MFTLVENNYCPVSIARSIADRFESAPLLPLGGVSKFKGSGVYGLYYIGSHDRVLSLLNGSWPVYVGSVKAPRWVGPQLHGTALWTRLSDHARSINQVDSLLIEDFLCRFMIVVPGQEKSVEDHLIDHHYKPVWNMACRGFGKDPDWKRIEKSPWDVVYFGRPWAIRQTNRLNKTKEIIQADMVQHMINCNGVVINGS